MNINVLLVTSGIVIANEPGGYLDQPQIVVCPNNVWLCVLTANSNGLEGSMFEHIASSRSLDNVCATKKIKFYLFSANVD